MYRLLWARAAEWPGSRQVGFTSFAAYVKIKINQRWSTHNFSVRRAYILCAQLPHNITYHRLCSCARVCVCVVVCALLSFSIFFGGSAAVVHTAPIIIIITFISRHYNTTHSHATHTRTLRSSQTHIQAIYHEKYEKKLYAPRHSDRLCWAHTGKKRGECLELVPSIHSIHSFNSFLFGHFNAAPKSKTIVAQYSNQNQNQIHLLLG